MSFQITFEPLDETKSTTEDNLYCLQNTLEYLVTIFLKFIFC